MKIIHASMLFTAASTAVFAAPDLDFGYATPVKPSAGYLNDWLRMDNPDMGQWDIGAQERLRYEARSHGGTSGPGAASDFKSSVYNDNHYFLSRFLPRVGYTDKWFQVFVQGKNSSVTGDQRPSVPGAVPPLGNHGASPESDGPIDLHQGYLFLGNEKEFPVTMKLGRQELIYGDERLIGPSGFNNVERSFDAAKVRYQNSWFGVDAFVSRVVLPEDNKFDESNPHDNFWGLYFDTAKIPGNRTEFYILGRNTSRLSSTLSPESPYAAGSARDIYTIGMRLKSTPGEWGNFDYTFESAGQFGRFVDGGRSEAQEAYMAFGGGSYTWKDAPFTPKTGIEMSYGSGDSNPKDNTHGTFENLFPTNHKFYGFADFVSLQNILTPRFYASVKPTPRTTLLAELHLYWLADTSDNFYTITGARRGAGAVQTAAQQGTGYGINPNAGSYVGSQVDLIANWALSPYIGLEAGYAHFFRGDYIKDSLAKIGSTDAEWIYVQTTINF
jgi:hypothetical protein